MTYRKIGILGGMGPAAGVYFAQQLIELNVAADRDARHAPFILHSDPSHPSRVDAYLNGQASPASSIAQSLDALHAQGADFGVIICNTAHIYFREIAARTALPLINMVETAASHMMKDAPPGDTGLLATNATVKSGLYARAVEARGGRVVTPTDADQEIISAVIFSPDHGIKATRTSPSDKAIRAVWGVMNRMREQAGVGRFLLGCTELSMAIPDDVCSGFEIVDPVKILARTCLHRAGCVTNPKDPSPCVA